MTIQKEVHGVYKVGDLVVYGAHGVCKIVDVEQRRIDRKNIEYYVLSPIRSETSCFYIPTQNEKALSKLLPLLSKDELKHLLMEQTNAEDPWVENENIRKQLIKDVLALGNRMEMIRWVRAMHIHRQCLLDCGKKLHQSDESFLKDAERILTTEFAIVLDIPEDSVRLYIQQIVM